MKSNLKLKSNLYLRDVDKKLEYDTDFVAQVRGIKAIRKMLWKAFEIPENANHKDSEIIGAKRTGRITEAQWNTLKWEIICFNCQSIPVGRTFDENIEFRCKVEGCK